jgi:hypothetical protein
LLDGLVQGDLVHITWIDSGMSLKGGWKARSDYERDLEEEDGHAALTVDTTGYYLGPTEREDLVLIAQSWDRFNDLYLNAQIIWVPALRGVKVLVPYAQI